MKLESNELSVYRYENTESNRFHTCLNDICTALCMFVTRLLSFRSSCSLELASVYARHFGPDLLLQ